MCITLPHPSDTRTASSAYRSAMPGSKPPSIRGPHIAESSPRDGFPFLGSHRFARVPFRGAASIHRAVAWVPSIRAAPDRSARGVGRGDPLGVRSVSPLVLLVETYVNNSDERALRRGSPVNVAGCHEGEKSSCCIHPPGASRCPLLGWTSRGDIGELVSPAAPIRRILALVDGRGVSSRCS